MAFHSTSSESLRPSRLPLAACLAAALTMSHTTDIAHAAPPPLALFLQRPQVPLTERLGLHASGRMKAQQPMKAMRPADTILVDNCSDSGTGSLREALNAAVDGDVIDMTQLACGTITLDTGIIATVGDVDIDGPGAAQLTIDAAGHGRALYHLGAGTMRLSGVTIANGIYASGTYYYSQGGCILSLGNVYLTDAVVTGCALSDTTPDLNGAGGGCIATAGAFTATDSIISGCSITSASGDDVAGGAGVLAGGNVGLLRSRVSGHSITADVGYSYGAGIASIGYFTAKYSTIEDNTVSGGFSRGGGVYAQAGAFVLRTTISGNEVDTASGIIVTGNSATDTCTILNSTISGNTARISVGGVVCGVPLALQSTTIVNNTSGMPYAAGLFIGDDLDIHSSIVANNMGGTALRDVGGNDNAAITGSNNLVRVSFLSLPADTIVSDPLLGPLAHNGGLTRTHAPLPGSPVIDAGNNVGDYEWDQRGSGFARVIGANADIGAYESDPDRIFANAFE